MVRLTGGHPQRRFNLPRLCLDEACRHVHHPTARSFFATTASQQIGGRVTARFGKTSTRTLTWPVCPTRIHLQQGVSVVGQFRRW